MQVARQPRQLREVLAARAAREHATGVAAADRRGERRAAAAARATSACLAVP